MTGRKVKVLMIHPEISRTKYNFAGVIVNECLELEYLSAVLKEKGHDAILYDVQVENGRIPAVLKRVKPDVVYVCGRTRQENFMLEYCRNAKEYHAGVVTIIGGVHAQLCYERMYADSVDYILTTFDCFKVLDIIDYAVCGKALDIDKMDGICYKQGGTWHANQALPFDINRLPLPDRSYFYAHPEHYRYLELEQAAWVRTAYSCPYSCKFCLRNRMNAGRYSRREIEKVVDEIQSIASDNIYIVDDDFLVDEKRLQKFVSLLKERKIRKNYICYGRADFIATHAELMKELKSVGLYYVLVGLEAFNNRYLEVYHKRSDMYYNTKSIEICHKLGIRMMGMFIVDLDYRRKDFVRLYRWIEEHGLRHVAISIFTPEPGLETFLEYQDRMITENPSHFDYLHLVAKPANLSVKRYYLYYYLLLIRLFQRARRDGIYDFLDYGDYIRSCVANIFRKRKNDDE